MPRGLTHYSIDCQSFLQTPSCLIKLSPPLLSLWVQHLAKANGRVGAAKHWWVISWVELQCRFTVIWDHHDSAPLKDEYLFIQFKCEHKLPSGSPLTGFSLKTINLTQNYDQVSTLIHECHFQKIEFIWHLQFFFSISFIWVPESKQIPLIRQHLINEYPYTNKYSIIRIPWGKLNLPTV